MTRDSGLWDAVEADRSWRKSTTLGAIVIETGVDIVAHDRVERALESAPNFESYAFTDRERDYCEQQVLPIQHFAARWAVKEAFIKTLGQLDDAFAPRAVGVARSQDGISIDLDDDAERELHRTVRARGGSPGGVTLLASLAHDATAETAVGQVVVCFDRDEQATDR